MTSPSTNKKGQVTPQSTKKKIPVHNELQASFPEKPSIVALIEDGRYFVLRFSRYYNGGIDLKNGSDQGT